MHTANTFESVCQSIVDALDSQDSGCLTMADLSACGDLPVVMCAVSYLEQEGRVWVDGHDVSVQSVGLGVGIPW